MTDAGRILDVLRASRFRYTNEDGLQFAIAVALTNGRIPFEREVRLEHASRIDFLAGDVGIEVKVAGSAANVRRQIDRYCRNDRIAALILLTDRVRHLTVPDRSNGKPVHVVSIAKQGL